MARRACGGTCGGGSAASPAMPARKVPSRSSRLAAAAEPKPWLTQEKNSRRSNGSLVSLRSRFASINMHKFITIEDGPGQGRGAVALHDLRGLPPFFGARAPSERKLVGALNLLRGIGPGFVLQPRGEEVGQVQDQGVVQKRQRLQWCGRRGAAGCRGRGVRAVEGVEKRTSAAASPGAIESSAGQTGARRVGG